MCVYLWVCICECLYLWRPVEGIRCPGSGVTGDFDTYMVARNKIWVSGRIVSVLTL